MAYELKKFTINGLFGCFTHELNFSTSIEHGDSDKLSVIVGRNGVGKTTILNMIEGILKLDFDTFREVPFEFAELVFSSDDYIKIVPEENFLRIYLNNVSCKVGMNAYSYESLDAKDRELIIKFIKIAKPIVESISFQKLDIHRSIALRLKKTKNDENSNNTQNDGVKKHINADRHIKLGNDDDNDERCSHLSRKVREFVREAQFDYKKYFTSDGPSLFTQILSRLKNNCSITITLKELIDRLEVIKSSEVEMSRFGLTLNISDINELTEQLNNTATTSLSEPAIAALEVYVQTLESKHDERCRIAARLTKFEDIVSGFLTNKKIHIDYDRGLKILASNNKEINELLLSSGEYHLLYMLVTALVSTRSGTVIAIDEPELSLHISWQRKLINALMQCSSGASPLFIFATHSSAIASEYEDKWIRLGL